MSDALSLALHVPIEFILSWDITLKNNVKI